MINLKNEAEMIAFGKRIGETIFPHSIITLTGDLGAGKTTFTKGIGQGLEIKKIINSPTFTIVKVYSGRMTLYHFDAYRLEGADDDLGFEEMFEDDGLCVIEWPQFIEDIIPEERLEIEIIKNEDETRSLKLHPIGEKYENYVRRLHMISLVMDTSNSYLAVGLFKDNMCLEAFQEKGSRRQSEKAIPTLKEVLDRHHIALKDVNEMIITSGPGSYTGVRVAMTIAKTLAAVSDVRIKSVSSLAAYAGMNQALSVIDARGHKVFVGVYENGLPLIKEQVVTLEDFAQLRAEYEDFELVGEVGCLGLDEKECDLCANIYALGQMADPIKNVDLLVPTYIKDVEAKKACY